MLNMVDSGQIVFSTPISVSNNTGDIRHDASNTLLLTTQLAFVLPLGTLCFLLFCYLRTRWNAMYAPRSRLIRLAPSPLPDSYFGWLVALFKIPESEVLDRVGLDATVLLAFFKMSYKLFAFCGILSLVVLSPIKLRSLPEMIGNGFFFGGPTEPINPIDPTDPKDPKDPNDPIEPVEPSEMLYLYVIFTWVFSIATYYFTYYNYRDFSEVRHRYYLKWKDTVASRTVMVTVIPKDLQTDAALTEFYNNLDLGKVENATVYRHVRKLRHAIERRAYYLKKLEEAYVQYLGNPCEDPNYDSSLAFETFEKALKDDPSTVNEKVAGVLSSVNATRPKFRTGFLGLFGKKVDKIGYYTNKFINYDQLVARSRFGAYDSTSIGFVTFKNITSAQLAAQVLIHPKPFKCSTELAPEPRDVFWYRLSIRKREMLIRDVLVNSLVILLAFSWTVPTAFLASFLNLETLRKSFPWLAELAEEYDILKYIIQGPLVTLSIVTLNATIPHAVEFLSKLQGIKSRSGCEYSTFSKYFFFLLFNVLLIFTVAGTVLNAIIELANNPIGIPLTLAKSLPRVAPFFVNYVVLQGIGLYPTRILMFKEIAMAYLLRVIFANTPRDFAEASTPQRINYGQELPPIVLVFILVLVYSTLTPIILLFGTIYFLFGYINFKYLLLYVYFHPYESAGLAWPKIFRRITIGLYIFQLLMIGYMSLKKSFYLAVSLAPLLIITTVYFYFVNEAFNRSSSFLPLNLLHKQSMEKKSKPDVKVRPMSQDLSSISSFDVLRDGGNILPSNSEDSKEEPAHSHRDVLENDLYVATPDSYTDYAQPPMTLYNGLLDTGMRNYTPPELTGSLPLLWLPVKSVKKDSQGFIRRLLGMNKKGSKDNPPPKTDPTNPDINSNQQAVDTTDTIKTSSQTDQIDNEEAGPSSSIRQNEQNETINTSEPEEIVISNELPSASSTLRRLNTLNRQDSLNKRKSRVRMMTDRIGELAGNNFE